MLRRLLEGVGLLLLVALVFSRFEVGFMLPILSVLAVIGFTAWRIKNLWHRYQVHTMVHRMPANRNVAVENEMLALRGQQHGRGAELTFWTGFMMGAPWRLILRLFMLVMVVMSRAPVEKVAWI